MMMVYVVGIVLFHGVLFLLLLLFGWFLVLLEYFDYFSFHFVLKFRDGNKFEAFDALKKSLDENFGISFKDANCLQNRY